MPFTIPVCSAYLFDDYHGNTYLEKGQKKRVRFRACPFLFGGGGRALKFGGGGRALRASRRAAPGFQAGACAERHGFGRRGGGGG